MNADELHRRLAGGEELAFAPSRGRLVLLIGICVLFVLDSGLMITAEEIMPRLVGWVALVFFGVAGIPVLSWQLIRNRPLLKVSGQHGVWVAQGEREWIPWGAIGQVALGKLSGQKMVAFEIDPQLYEQKFSGNVATRGLSAANEHIMGGTAIAIPSTLKIKPETLHEWLSVEVAQRNGQGPSTAYR